MADTEDVLNLVANVQDKAGERLELMAAMHAGDYDRLNVTDYTRAMQLSDGRICLRAQLPSPSSPEYYQWTADGIKSIVPNMDEFDAPESAYHLSDDIKDDNAEVRPVLVENTPFVEDNE